MKGRGLSLRGASLHPRVVNFFTTIYNAIHELVLALGKKEIQTNQCGPQDE